VKLGVISDTHLHLANQELAELMAGPFKEVDRIVHAGDLTELAVLEAFKGKEVLAVCGNMDSPSVRKQLPSQRVFHVGKFKVGLVHGWGAPPGIEERIRRELEDVDCIIYGHTHAPSQNLQQGTFFFNPGSFGGGVIRQRSVGLLELGSTISGQIIYL
jgi:putative phosphoesterase